MTFQFVTPPPQTTPMPKQEETINLFDPDTSAILQVPTSQLMQKIEHEKVFGIPDNVQIPQETMDAIQKQFGTALKFDQDKLPLHLLSTEAMNQTAAVLAFGAEKYAAHNWRKGFAWSRPLAAAMRHITAFNAGEDKDPESGLSHLAHAACCIMFLLEFEKTHKELDDRYKP
jgi:hypothetical protein